MVQPMGIVTNVFMCDGLPWQKLMSNHLIPNAEINNTHMHYLPTDYCFHDFENSPSSSTCTWWSSYIVANGAQL